MKLRDVHIQSLGVHLPDTWLSREQAREQGLYDDELVQTDLTGVHIADDITPADMAVHAARQAVERSGGDPATLDRLIHAAIFWQGPEGWSPVGYILRELGCRRIPGEVIFQGCNGIIAAVELAAGSLALGGEDATALLTTTASAHSPCIDRWRSAGIGIVLGDGAGAVLLGKTPGLARVDAINSMNFPELEALHRGTVPLFEPDDPARPKLDVVARSREFAITSGMRPIDLYGRLVAAYTEVVHRSLDEVGVKPEDIARVVFPNMGPHIVETSIMKPLGLPMAKSTWEFGRSVGHIGATDHVVGLDRLLNAGRLHPGDTVLLVGGSAGYNAASAVLTITDVPR